MAQASGREAGPCPGLNVAGQEAGYRIRNISQPVICSATLKHAPKVFAFTEEGVAMLSGVLHSPQAIEVNITIMRAFVRLR